MSTSIVRPNQAARQPKQSSNCFRSSRISGPCSECGLHPDVLHVPLTMRGVFCERCCPACSAKPAEAAAMSKRRRTCEAYEITCHVCYCTVEIAYAAVQGNIGICPRCGSRLRIEWLEGRAAI
jgi:hypothetical protein